MIWKSSVGIENDGNPSGILPTTLPPMSSNPICHEISVVITTAVSTFGIRDKYVQYVLVEELRNMCVKVLYTIIVNNEMKYNCSVV